MDSGESLQILWKPCRNGTDLSREVCSLQPKYCCVEEGREQSLHVDPSAEGRPGSKRLKSFRDLIVTKSVGEARNSKMLNSLQSPRKWLQTLLEEEQGRGDNFCREDSKASKPTRVPLRQRAAKGPPSTEVRKCRQDDARSAKVLKCRQDTARGAAKMPPRAATSVEGKLRS